MRTALCVRHEKTIYRLVWLNESKAGIYIGVLGSEQDSHISYHQDGTRHTKMGSEYHNRFSDVPISSHTGFRQLEHLSLSLTRNWFNAKTIYTGDARTESIVLLDERLFYDKDTLALDVWMTDRQSEQDLLESIAKHTLTRENFQVVTEFVSALEYFPNQKIALTLCSARVRGVDSSQLMFPPMCA
ncbi:MAG TPA: hypothetical protein VGK14_07045 [Novimethylophilus sp.]|jgi:thymidine kinase|uniref:hypothetical protein n=1 Tax=Novimethylophilus sp. TaxID=2137426 RepID=UPI002F408EDD